MKLFVGWVKPTLKHQIWDDSSVKRRGCHPHYGLLWANA